MTDLDFYTKALRLQSWVLKQVAQIKAYNEHWDAEYCKRKVTEWLDTFADNNDVKEVLLSKILHKKGQKLLDLDFGTEMNFQISCYSPFGIDFFFLMELK